MPGPYFDRRRNNWKVVFFQSFFEAQRFVHYFNSRAFMSVRLRARLRRRRTLRGYAVSYPVGFNASPHFVQSCFARAARDAMRH